MTTSGCDLADIGLNNQLLVGGRLHERTRANGLGRCFDSPPPTAARDPCPGKDEPPGDMALLPDLGVDAVDGIDGRNVDGDRSTTGDDPRETRHLKDLLLLHLDWIQRQQQGLQEKDRQIQRLKQEKEALKCRLERMQRRMALLRQKSEPSPLKANEQKLKIASPASPSVQNATPGRGSKRKLSFEPCSLNKKFQTVIEHKAPTVEMLNKSTSTDADLPSSPMTKRPRHRLSRPVGRRASFRHCQQFSQQPLRKCRSQLATDVSTVVVHDGRTKTEQAEVERSDTDVESQNSSPHRQEQVESNERLLRTSVLYYVHSSSRLASCEISPVKEQPEEVKVPTFRIKHVPTGYQLEGTENLTDEAFLKRHQKPEADEKRRKRWDAQMLREQKMLERLQRRERVLTIVKNGCTSMSRRQQEREEIHSFLPDPKNAKYIEVCDEIPVNVFGYAVPHLEPVEFSLPWYEGEKQAKDDKCRFGVSRAHRK